MIIDKNIAVDLNRVQPMKTIHVHEGDVNSVRLVLSVTKDTQDVDLTNFTVRYDAAIGNYLAEQDAVGSVENSKVIVPLTQTMTAMSGILKVDIKLIENTSVLFTQTIKLFVDRSVIGEDTIIDISGTTIGQKIANFEARLDGFETAHYTKTETDNLLNSYYTKTEADTLLNAKVKYEYHQGITAADLDTYTDAQTLYRIYYEGTYQFLICTSGTGGQYRFTKFGDIYYRVYQMGSNTWSEWELLGAIANNSLSGAKLTNGTVTNAKLQDTYYRLFTNFNLDNAGQLEDVGIYKGTATSTWQTRYNVSGDFILYHDTDRQIIYFNTDNRTFLRTRSAAVQFHSWNSWVEITPITESRVNTLITTALGSYYTKTETDNKFTLYYTKTEIDTKFNSYYNKTETDTKFGSYYTKTEADTKFDNRLKVVTNTSATLADCDNCTDPGTLYHLYISGLYQILINTSNTGGQYRFTRDGRIYYRTYNTGNNTWSDWSSLPVTIPSGTITTAMLTSNFLLSYDNIEDEYIRYFDMASASEFDTLFNYGIYTGTANNVWTSQYNVTGNFILLVLDENQLLFWPDSNRLFVRIRPINGNWQTWTDISPITESRISTIAGTVADNKLTNYYTKNETNTRLNGKENIVTMTNAQLSDCDDCVAVETIYRLIINGQDHLLINAGAHATQYRFTNGSVFYRKYQNSAWGSWANILTLIPDDTIDGDMIQYNSVGPEHLEEAYMLAVADESTSNINDWSRGVYTGTLGENWRARYGYDGHFILIADEIQIMYVIELNRILWRTRGVAHQWESWEDLDLVDFFELHAAVRGESGTIGQNYAWYTEPSQGLSLTGTYTLIGDFCTVNGTCPLIEGWDVVYYSLPCAAIFSSGTIARCGNDALSVVTNSINNVSVLEIRKIGGGSLPSGTISFTLNYRYTQS